MAASTSITLDPVNVTAAASTPMSLDDLQVNAPAPTPNRGPPPNPDREELVIYTGGRRLYGWMYSPSKGTYKRRSPLPSTPVAREWAEGRSAARYSQRH